MGVGFGPRAVSWPTPARKLNLCYSDVEGRFRKFLVQAVPDFPFFRQEGPASVIIYGESCFF